MELLFYWNQRPVKREFSFVDNRLGAREILDIMET